jgi:hypothetical protein
MEEEQVRDRGLTKVEKKDSRYKPARWYPAVETEALKQTEVQRILRAALDDLVPTPRGSGPPSKPWPRKRRRSSRMSNTLPMKTLWRSCAPRLKQR